MSRIGMERRRSRLNGANGRTFLLAIDHGLPAGPIPGIERPAEFLRRMGSVPFSGLIVNPGLMMAYAAAEAGKPSEDAAAAAHAARAAAEIGATFVQTNFVAGADGVRTIVRGCPVPVVVAGGPRTIPENAFLEVLRETLRA